MAGKPGRDWGGARSKYSAAKLKQALEMRAKGARLHQIAKATGLSPSYVCKLTSKFLQHGRGRTAGLPTKVSLVILRLRLTKVEKEAREIRSRIALLTGAEKHGKPRDAAKGRASALPTGHVAPGPGDEVREVRGDAPIPPQA